MSVLVRMTEPLPAAHRVRIYPQAILLMGAGGRRKIGAKKYPSLSLRTYRQMVWTAVKPDQQTWQGATCGLAAVTLLLIIAFVGSVALGSWTLITLAVLIPLTVLLAFLSGMLTDPLWAC